MDKVKELFYHRKQQLNQIQAPAELEQRLSQALIKQPKSVRLFRMKKLWRYATAFIIMILIINHAAPSLAYYGKKLLGYDHIISDTLQHLNEGGLGQAINKSLVFENGLRFTVDGVMVDDNQLVMFYTLESPKPLQDNPNYDVTPQQLTGFLTNASAISGVGEYSEDGKKLKGVQTFAPPNGFARALTIEFWGTNQTLTFTYNPAQALGHSIKQSIRKSVKLDGGSLTIQTLTASPTQTKIAGRGDKAVIEGLTLDQIKLLINNEEVVWLGSSIKTGITGTTFEINYDALPTDLATITLKLMFPDGQIVTIYQ
ncbi:protein of unknown function [Amphibacillus marinus]|uniref:DUF4179 domain-containing protein n=1 Tax=Amphibacillus marinus TaxID=872970 RepID=A0A1H8IVI6_9BACI|nr:DUF4179 domain-containing protein [Amphibacillus marinus]SEN72770.1 protein of unknown function [Amphibacillus marinus]